MPLFSFKCSSCGSLGDELMSYELSLSGIKCPDCKGRMMKVLTTPGKCRVDRANDLDYFGTPKYHEDRSKKCGLSV